MRHQYNLDQDPRNEDAEDLSFPPQMRGKTPCPTSGETALRQVAMVLVVLVSYQPVGIGCAVKTPMTRRNSPCCRLETWRGVCRLAMWDNDEGKPAGRAWVGEAVGRLLLAPLDPTSIVPLISSLSRLHAISSNVPSGDFTGGPLACLSRFTLIVVQELWTWQHYENIVQDRTDAENQVRGRCSFASRVSSSLRADISPLCL